MSSIKFDYRIKSNSINAIVSILFYKKNKIALIKINKHSVSSELEGFHP